MSISAKVVADSKNEFGNRITTMIVTFPRIILAEFNTHRMFSRNSASSRAIPFEKMVKSVKENPFIPIAWQKDHKGMQGTEYITDPEIIRILTQRQKAAAEEAAWRAESFNKEYEVTKQLCNRYLEPFMWHTVIVTATEWENFFALRCPRYEIPSDDKVYRSRKDAMKGVGANNLALNNNPHEEFQWRSYNKGQAEIHMMALAEAMWDAYNESSPKELKGGEWHIPFRDNITAVPESVWELCGYKESDPYFADYSSLQLGKAFTEIKVKIATAMCARVSYTVVGEEGKVPNYENDIKLHDRLAASGHWSPFEHCAKAMEKSELWYYTKQSGKGLFGMRDNGQHENLGWFGNFKGFIQYRKTFKNENIQ